jgi:hypothetical protein
MWQQRKHFSADDGNFKAKNIFSLRQLFIIWQFSIAPVRCVFGPAVKNSSRSTCGTSLVSAVHLPFVG